MTHDTPFSALPADFMATLFGQARTITLARNQTLFRAGDPCDGCYRIVEGLLKVTAGAPASRERILAIRGPAALVGELSLGGEVAVMLAAERPQLIAALIVGDAPLSIKHHLTEEPAEHRAQNVLWQTLCGRPVDEIEAAIRRMPIYVPSENVARPASEVLGNESPFFPHQAVSLHQLDPDMLAAVNAGPLPMLDGYEPETLLPAITCPVLLLQADPMQGSALSDADVTLALNLLPNATLLRLAGLGHPLHGPQPKRVAGAIMPFLSSVRLPKCNH